MEKINLLDETVIAIFNKNDFANPAIRLFGNTIFSENEKLEKLRKIFNSKLKNNIEQVIIGQVNNDIDIYTCNNDNIIFKEGNWSQALNDLPIKNNLDIFNTKLIDEINNLLKIEFNENDYTIDIDDSENELSINFSDEIFDIYDLNISDKNIFLNKLNKILSKYKFEIYDDYQLLITIEIPEPCKSKYKEYKL